MLALCRHPHARTESGDIAWQYFSMRNIERELQREFSLPRTAYRGT
jgi:hypothetical protein